MTQCPVVNTDEVRWARFASFISIHTDLAFANVINNLFNEEIGNYVSLLLCGDTTNSSISHIPSVTGFSCGDPVKEKNHRLCDITVQ